MFKAYFIMIIIKVIARIYITAFLPTNSNEPAFKEEEEVI